MLISASFFSHFSVSEFNGVPLDSQPQLPSVQTELIMLSLPAIAGQAIEPLAQLMETAYIGRLGKFLVPILIEEFPLHVKVTYYYALTYKYLKIINLS